MKLRNPILFVILALTSCKSPVALFNHVPKNYYTRHHTEDVQPQKREPIACLTQKPRVEEKKEVQMQDLFVSKNNQFFDNTLRPNYERSKEVFSTQNRVINLPDSTPDQSILEKEFEPLGILSAASGIAFWTMVYINIVYSATLMSVLSLPILSGLALVLGFLSIFKIKKEKEKFMGRGFAYFGILTTIIPVLLLLLSIILIFTAY